MKDKGKAPASRHDHPCLTVGASFVMMMTIWGTFSTFGVFFEPLIQEHGWTRALTSGAASLNNLSFGIACIFAAGLSERFGPRVVLSGMGLGTFLTPLAAVRLIDRFRLYFAMRQPRERMRPGPPSASALRERPVRVFDRAIARAGLKESGGGGT